MKKSSFGTHFIENGHMFDNNNSKLLLVVIQISSFRKPYLLNADEAFESAKTKYNRIPKNNAH